MTTTATDSALGTWWLTTLVPRKGQGEGDTTRASSSTTAPALSSGRSVRGAASDQQPADRMPRALAPRSREGSLISRRRGIAVRHGTSLAGADGRLQDLAGAHAAQLSVERGGRVSVPVRVRRKRLTRQPSPIITMEMLMSDLVPPRTRHVGPGS